MTKHVSMAHNIIPTDFYTEYPEIPHISQSCFDKLSNLAKDNWKNNPEYAEKCSSYFRSQEHAIQHSNYMKKVWQIPEIRDMYTEINREIGKRENVRKARSNNLKLLHKTWYKTPEGQEQYRINGLKGATMQIERGYVSKQIYYNGNFYKSNYEKDFAIKLDELHIVFEYEKTYFEYVYENKIHRYYPDFYLPEFNLYIEIKPSCLTEHPKNIAKFNSVLANKHNLKVITEKELYQSNITRSLFII